MSPSCDITEAHGAAAIKKTAKSRVFAVKYAANNVRTSIYMFTLLPHEVKGFLASSFDNPGGKVYIISCAVT
jgi:hypothetical protein